MPPPRGRAALLLAAAAVVLAGHLPTAAPAAASGDADANKLHEDETVVTLHADAVAGGVAKLACDITPPIVGDKATLVIWFKEGTPKPIYSYDARGGALAQAKHWADDTFGGRAFFRTADSPAQLTVESARDLDAGMYRCRVDFGRSPTRNARVNLTVILPPEQLLIMDNRGEHIRHHILGPYNEGDTVEITCEASGGRPQPRVTWWTDNVMLDDSYERRSERRVQNVLRLENLQRKQLNRQYTCKASNNLLAAPVTSSVRLDMNLRPLSVRLLGENRPFSAEKSYEVSCEVVGARPSPQISWWKGNTQLKNNKEVTTQDQNSTISTLLYSPKVDDSGMVLSCRAENPRLPNSALVDSWTLDIYHVPVVTLQLGRPLNASAMTEGVDVFFECHIKANPRIFRVGWRHERQPLIQNASAGTIISNQSLVLQSVSRARAGMYTCVAYNQEGDGESNPVRLDVKYRPVCKPGQQAVWGVGRGETITIPCDVDSNPDEVTFAWRLNTTSDSVELPPSRHKADRAQSLLTHTPQSERDYGTLLCWGTNFLGTQKQPCTFLVIPAGKPNSPINCSLTNQTTDSLSVACSEGFDGGVPRQEFVLELYDEATHALVSNVTARSPVFNLGGLDSGLDFRVELYAYNTKGRSEPVTMRAFTLKGAERRLAATQATLQITPLVGLLVGVVASLVLAAVLIVVVLRMRGRGESNDEKSEEGSRRDKNATISTAKADTEQGGAGPGLIGPGLGDENNPDLIPDKSVYDSYSVISESSLI